MIGGETEEHKQLQEETGVQLEETEELEWDEENEGNPTEKFIQEDVKSHLMKGKG